MRNILALALVPLVMTLSFAGTGKPLSGLADGEPFYEFVPSDVLVKFKVTASASEIADLAAQLGGRVAEWSHDLDYYRVEIPATTKTEDAVLFFRESPQVEWANFNYIAHACYTPNDQYYQYQWHYPRINLPQAWDITRGNSNVVVAVCDQGFQFAHTDWAGVQTVSPHDFIDDDNDPSTNIDYSHGMHVAGTIFAATDNNIGVAGVAPLCRLMPLRVMDDGGSGTMQDISDGITWAANNSAELLNLSLGLEVTGPPQDPGPPLSTAIAAAANAGVVIFAASGNDSMPYVGYPAAYQQCIAIGATKYSDVRAIYSNYGAALDIVAPGGKNSEDLNSDGQPDGVLSTVRANNQWNYAWFDGTSMATPHACGVGALLMSNGLAGSQVRQVLQTTAVDLGGAGWDSQYGYGRIDAYAALQSQGGGNETTLLEQAFESFPPSGWQLLENEANGVGWQDLAGTTPYCGGPIPHGGNNAIWHDDEDLSGQHQDDWLISPYVQIPQAATNIRLSFWERNCWIAWGFYEHHGLWYQVGSGAWTLLNEYPDQQGDWAQVTVNADAFAGDNVHFAWRYQGTYATEWFLDDVMLTATGLAADDPPAALPGSMALLDPYPNPFNSVATIPFELSAPGRVEISIHNLLGQRVTTIASDEEFSAGRHQLVWDATEATSGLYFVKLTSGVKVQTRKLLLVR